VTWKVVDGPPTDKPTTTLVLTVGDLIGDLVLWVSGEAEMTWGTPERGGERHFDIASRDQLSSCVDELEESLGVG